MDRTASWGHACTSIGNCTVYLGLFPNVELEILHCTLHCVACICPCLVSIWTLLTGHTNVAQDKFLIMVKDLGNNGSYNEQDLSQLWRVPRSDDANYMEHRLCCSRTASRPASPASFANTHDSPGRPDNEVRVLITKVIAQEEILKLKTWLVTGLHVLNMQCKQ